MHANLRLSRETGLSLNPRVVQSHIAKHCSRANGDQFNYCEYGDPQGLEVVFFHDFASSRLEASLFSKAAFEAGLRIIAVDRLAMMGNTDTNLSIESFSASLEMLMNKLGIEKYTVLASGLALNYALGHANANPNRVIAITALCAGRTSILSVYRAIPLPLRPCADFILKTFISLRAKRFAKRPEQYLDRYAESLNYSDRRLLRRGAVRESMINNLLETSHKGAQAILQDLKSCLRAVDETYEDVRVRVDFWSGAADKRAKFDLRGLGLSNAVYHCVPKAGELFYLSYMGLVFEQLRASANKTQRFRQYVQSPKPTKAKAVKTVLEAKSVSA